MTLQTLSPYFDVPTHPHAPPIPMVEVLCTRLAEAKVPTLYIRRTQAILRDLVLTQRQELALLTPSIQATDDLTLSHNRPLLLEHVWPDLEPSIAKVLSANPGEGGGIEDKLLYIQNRIGMLLTGWHTQYVEAVPNEVFETAGREIKKLFAQDVEDATINKRPFPQALREEEQQKIAALVQAAIDGRKQINTSGFRQIDPDVLHRTIISQMIAFATESLAKLPTPPETEGATVEADDPSLSEPEIEEPPEVVTVTECDSTIPDDPPVVPDQWIVFDEAIVHRTLDELIRSLPSATYLDVYAWLAINLHAVPRRQCAELPGIPFWNASEFLSAITADEDLAVLDPQQYVVPHIAAMIETLVEHTAFLFQEHHLAWKDQQIRRLDEADQETPWTPLPMTADYPFVEHQTRYEHLTEAEMTTLLADDETGLAYAFYDQTDMGKLYPSAEATALLRDLVTRVQEAYLAEVIDGKAVTARVVGQVLRHLGDLRLPPSLADPIITVLQSL